MRRAVWTGSRLFPVCAIHCRVRAVYRRPSSSPGRRSVLLASLVGALVGLVGCGDSGVKALSPTDGGIDSQRRGRRRRHRQRAVQQRHRRRQRRPARLSGSGVRRARSTTTRARSRPASRATTWTPASRTASSTATRAWATTAATGSSSATRVNTNAELPLRRGLRAAARDRVLGLGVAVADLRRTLPPAGPERLRLLRLLRDPRRRHADPHRRRLHRRRLRQPRPSARACTQVTQCSNPCERCEICVGKPTMPADCATDGGTTVPKCDNG